MVLLLPKKKKKKRSWRFKSGVKKYTLTYYTNEYETKDIDILTAFRVIPQPEVAPTKISV